MDREVLFKENLDKWAKVTKDNWQIIRNTQCDQTEFCKSDNGLINLKVIRDHEAKMLHNQEDPLKEANRWVSTLNLNQYSVIYVYGVGLGYYYQVLSAWLTSSPNRYLVFLESDPEVLHRFFETECAKEMLHNPNVRIYYVGDKASERAAMDEIAIQFYPYRYKVSALLDYLHFRSKDLIRLNTLLDYVLNMQSILSVEYNLMSQAFFINFYANLSFLSHAKHAANLFGCFKGVPAIICGAGPSFQKNIDQLAALKDKAFIIAGGTAINVLNQAGIEPHIGIGIDPHPDQAMRILTNTSFMLPFFYHSRMNHTALQILQGDLLYINGSMPYPITSWLEEGLGIFHEPINEGNNVVNLSLSVAHLLGCSPIITVGVDLAYSENKSYAPLTENHPLNYPNPIFRTKSTEEELMSRNDIYGNPVLTLWKWMQESVWFSKYYLDNPEVNLINATEGGLGFPGVENVDLEDVAKKHLQGQFDLSGFLHALIQASEMPKNVNNRAIFDLLNQVKSSLDECNRLCVHISNTFLKIKKDIESGKAAPKHFVNQDIIDYLIELQGSLGYDVILCKYESFYIKRFTKELKSLTINEEVLSKEEIDAKRVEIYSYRYILLSQVARYNINLIEQSIKYIQNEEILSKKVSEVVADSEIKSILEHINKNYIFDEKRYSINDKELGLSFDETLPPLGKGFELSKTDLENGVSQVQYFKEGKLHGPSKSYVSGKLSCINWYKEGQKVGRSLYYYKDGNLFALLSAKDGDFEGIQKYFYENQSLRASIQYLGGALHGTVKMYYPNGQLKRSLGFNQGKREGQEGLWMQDGTRIIEAEYGDGRAVGSAKYFSAEGKLIKEVQFGKDGLPEAIYALNVDGNLSLVPLEGKEDYFDSVTSSTSRVTDSLTNLFLKIDGIINIIEKDQGKKLQKIPNFEQLKDEIKVIKENLNVLKSLEQEMSFESQKGSDDTGEQIWKTPTARTLLKEKIDTLSSALRRNLELVETRLKEVLDPYIER